MSPLPQVVDLSEVLVQRDDDPLLPFGACDDLLIGQLGRGGAHDVEREGLAKKRSGLRGKVDIEEKLAHSDGWSGRTSSRSIRASEYATAALMSASVSSGYASLIRAKS